MTTDPDDDYLDETYSTISISRQYVELLQQLLDDVDHVLRQPLIIDALRQAARHGANVDVGYLIDMVGFNALRLHQVITDANTDRPTLQ